MSTFFFLCLQNALLTQNRLYQWFSGKILACHASAPGSIPGWYNSFCLFGLRADVYSHTHSIRLFGRLHCVLHFLYFVLCTLYTACCGFWIFGRMRFRGSGSSLYLFLRECCRKDTCSLRRDMLHTFCSLFPLASTACCDCDYFDFLLVRSLRSHNWWLQFFKCSVELSGVEPRISSTSTSTSKSKSAVCAHCLIVKMWTVLLSWLPESILALTGNW